MGSKEWLTSEFQSIATVYIRGTGWRAKYSQEIEHHKAQENMSSSLLTSAAHASIPLTNQ